MADISQYFSIFLNNLRFYSRIGVSDQERKVGNEFEVNVKLTYDASEFVKESLDSTISYAEVYEQIKAEMGSRRLLLETVAIDIANRLTSRWNIINELQVNIIKVAPPISGITGNCGVEFFWKKR